MMNEWGWIVSGAEIGRPKVFVGRFKAEVKVEAVAEDKDYFAGATILEMSLV